MDVGLEIKKLEVGGRIVPGRRVISINGVQWGVARSLNQKCVWAIRDLNGNDLEHVTPTGKKSLIDESIRVAVANLITAGKLKQPPVDQLRIKHFQKQADEKRRADENKKLAAVDSVIQALKFIVDNHLLDGGSPYHVLDQASRKARRALQDAGV